MKQISYFNRRMKNSSSTVC